MKIKLSMLWKEKQAEMKFIGFYESKPKRAIYSLIFNVLNSFRNMKNIDSMQYTKNENKKIILQWTCNHWHWNLFLFATTR